VTTLQEVARRAGVSKSTVSNVIRGGAYSEAEWENGAWRHRVSTQRMAVVIEFEAETALMVVTAFVLK
jgi:transcriptional regulator with XRE-family HTH domain